MNHIKAIWKGNNPTGDLLSRVVDHLPAGMILQEPVALRFP